MVRASSAEGLKALVGREKQLVFPLRDQLLADNSWWGRERGVVQWQAGWKDLQRPPYQCSLKELQQNLLGHQTTLTDTKTEGRQEEREQQKWEETREASEGGIRQKYFIHKYEDCTGRCWRKGSRVKQVKSTSGSCRGPEFRASL